MKTKITARILLLSFLTTCAISCQANRPNGWYCITDGVSDSISSEPIVTTADFEALRLDSSVNSQSGELVYQIAGTLNKQAALKWADATEKCIGKRIGFVYDNKVVCDPTVNSRIESGNFAISTNKGYDIKALYEKLKQ